MDHFPIETNRICQHSGSQSVRRVLWVLRPVSWLRLQRHMADRKGPADTGQLFKLHETPVIKKGIEGMKASAVS